MATCPRRATRGAAIVLALALAGCQAASTAAPSVVANLPSAPSSPAVTAAPSLPALPPGRILFEREDSDGEHYFTIRTDGTDEHAIYDREGCECAHWMADGTRVMTIDATGHGNYSFMTILPDGTDRVVLDGPSRTLNLAPGATTLDGRQIAFNGWDDTDPSKTGVYLAAPDLSDLRLVLPLREGWLAVEPSGITPDASRVLFFVDTGPFGRIDHAGNLFVVEADGTRLRQLNPINSKLAYITGGGIPGSLSPDGRHAAFTVDDAVWVVDLEGGEARRISNQDGFVWAVSWSPTGEWINYTRFHGPTTTISLVRPDGTEQREISKLDETDEANSAFWSPDGRYLVVNRDSDASLDGPRDIWLMDLEGRYVGQVTHTPSDYGIYGWAPRAG